LVGRSHLVLEWGITPIGIPRAEPLVKISGLRVDLELARPTNHDVAEHCKPPVGPKDLVGSPPPDCGIDPVPRRGRDEHVESFAAVIPFLEGRGLDRDVRVGTDAIASEVRRGLTALQRSDGTPEGPERLSRLASTAADLEDRALPSHTGDSDEILEHL